MRAKGRWDVASSVLVEITAFERGVSGIACQCRTGGKRRVLTGWEGVN